jgi:PAS domain S-box-containing protein
MSGRERPSRSKNKREDRSDKRTQDRPPSHHSSHLHPSKLPPSPTDAARARAHAVSPTMRRESLADEVMRYVRLDPKDGALVRALRPSAEPHFEPIAELFYDRIREHEGAHDVFVDEAQVERLKRSMVGWLQRIFRGTYDEAFFEESAKIGQTHVRVGLPSYYMPTAMSVLRGALSEIADSALGPAAAPTRTALGKVLDAELVIMLEAYGEAARLRARRLEQTETDGVTRNAHRYENAVELANVLMVGIDSQGKIRLWNREAERVTGFGRDEVVGQDFLAAVVPEALHDEQRELFRRTLREASVPDVVEGAVRTRSGKVREVHWQLAFTPGTGEEGEIALFAIGKDVTTELALAARVRQSEKLAAVGTLAAGLAHEIRNPLNGAQLHLTFLERGFNRLGLQDEDTTEALRVVRAEIKRLSMLVSEFLDFARPLPLERKSVSLLELCTQAVALVQADAEEARVSIRTDLPSSDVSLDADPEKLALVFANLLRNAVESVATTGGGRVSLRARRKPRQVVFEVEDEGPGIANPESPIFDPFFSTKPTGTGLGLSVVHRIVTDHGGTVDFTSRPGRTVFRVTLPVHLSP